MYIFSNSRFAGKSTFRTLFSTVLLCFLLGGAACSFESDDEKFTRLVTAADSYLKEAKFEEARISLQSAIRLNPKEADPYFKLADILVRQKSFEKAISNYRYAIELNPKHIEAQLHLAALMLAAGKDEIAESSVQKVLELDKENPIAKTILANVLMRRNNYAGARAAYEEILAKHPENISAIAGKAALLLREGNTDAAEALFIEAINLDPSSSPVQLALVELYSAQGRYDDAEEILGALVKENPSNTSLRYYFAEFLTNQGLGIKAIAQYEKTLLDEPGRIDVRDRLYDMYVFQKNYDKARELTASLKTFDEKHKALDYFAARDFELDGKLELARGLHLSAIDGLTNFAPVFRRVGIVELNLGKVSEAIEHLNQAITISPHDLGARMALARHFFQRRELGIATEHVDKVLARFPRQIGANTLRADIALLNGKTDVAERTYLQFIKTFPRSPKGYIKMGLLEEQRGNTEAALEQYRTALSFDRNIWLPLRRLTTLLYKRDGAEKTLASISELAANSQKSEAEYLAVQAHLLLAADSDNPETRRKARGLLDSSIAANPNLLATYTLLARLDRAEGNTQSAKSNYKKLIELEPKKLPYRMLLAMIYEQKGQFEQAANAYREMLKINSQFGPAANNLAWILAEETSPANLEDALRLAQIAKKEMSKESAVSDTLGWIYHRRGASRVALPLIEEALELEQAISGGESNANPEMVYHLGAVQHALGNTDQARATLNDALRASNSRPKLKTKIEALLKEIG